LLVVLIYARLVWPTTHFGVFCSRHNSEQLTSRRQNAI
jgi:hypothetical protein